MTEVTNPRRVLAVSLADSTQQLSRVIQELTGAIPEPASTSLAGTTHVLDIKTSYYTAQVPIWLDLISSPSEWSASFLSPEAKEVLSVLGGLAIVFALPSSTSTATEAADPVAVPALSAPSVEETRALIEEVGKVVREGLGGWAWDGVGLGIGVGEGDSEEWEELCAEWGLEFVQVRGGKKDEGRNEFGEKMGIPRVREALESNDWAADAGPDVDSDLDEIEAELARKPKPLAGGDDDDDDDDEFEFDPESLDFGFDPSDFEGLKKAIWNLEQEQQTQDSDGEEKKKTEGASTDKVKSADEKEAELDAEEVEKLEGMMRKLQAVRDMSAGLPEEQRKKMARKAVGEVMKEL